MYNVIIFGTGKSSSIVESGLNQNVNIVCYLDNDMNKWGKVLRDKVIYNPSDIEKYSYDYIVIASQYNIAIYEQLISLNVQKEKILQFYKYMDFIFNYVEAELNILKDTDPEVIGTGISYMKSAIETEILCKKYFSIANPSQDLYFDYELVSYIINSNKYKLNKLKYMFIGLNYYSFQYDLSKSSIKEKVLMYYKVIHKCNNYNNINESIIINNVNEDIAKKIFYINEFNAPELNWSLSDSITYVNEENGKRQALIDGRKNYPMTVNENRQILKKYISLLKSKDIKPIIIVCPVSKYYAKYFSHRLKDEFNAIINEICKQYDFQFIDYFSNNLFNDEDFYDVSHLNSKGAEKFTKILNNIVEW